jgi:hypothetical protein
MKKHIASFPLLLMLLILAASCSKEQKLSDKLNGKWIVQEIRFTNDSALTDFNNNRHFIEFFGGKRAYTATFLGVYTIDYADENLKDVVDTFRYDIKGDQLSITNTQSTAVRNLIRLRYKIETLNDAELFLNRTPLDTLTRHLKAIR